MLSKFPPLCVSRHDKTTKLPARGISPSDASRQLAVLDPEPKNPFRQLLAKYPGLTNPNFSTSIPPHDVVHRLRTTGSPAISRPRSLVPARLSAAKAEFKHMLQMGIIHQSESPWTSAHHMVTKAATGRFEDGRHFPFGLFEFLRRPFGLRNAPQTVQRFVEGVLRGLPFVHSYIDDLLIANSTAEELMEQLATVFDGIRQFGVVVNPSNQLQRFPGMVNFYRRFLLHGVDTILPLTSLLSRPKYLFELSADALAVFDKVKPVLADATAFVRRLPVRLKLLFRSAR
ncbi:hypothetical protein SprV_0602111800 [Sparganum proliferum]